ncbi:hypothetical protein B484DRAFT_258354, partial [Ochromonadaceae sp. CCMP2298]
MSATSASSTGASGNNTSDTAADLSGGSAFSPSGLSGATENHPGLSGGVMAPHSGGAAPPSGAATVPALPATWLAAFDAAAPRLRSLARFAWQFIALDASVRAERVEHLLRIANAASSSDTRKIARNALRALVDVLGYNAAGARTFKLDAAYLATATTAAPLFVAHDRFSSLEALVITAPDVLRHWAVVNGVDAAGGATGIDWGHTLEWAQRPVPQDADVLTNQEVKEVVQALRAFVAA